MKLKLIIHALLYCFTLTAFSSQKLKNQHGEASSQVETEKVKTLSCLQQEFLDLRFGMFIHFNMPSYSSNDWCDPEMSPQNFNPVKLDCNQWADAAVSAGMQYGCLTTKHHTGFCIWPTLTTDYHVMNSPAKRDIVKEYTDAFRKRGLKVFLYYSILDLHHQIRPGWIRKEHVQFIKDQLTELLTNYGEISCLVFDGWDAHWSRISYSDIPFDEIYTHVKNLQPNCLISEHNAGKYPSDELFYTDIKHYEQNAGQIISKETNQLPAQAGIPINKSWFWKENFPRETVKPAKYLIAENLIPLNNAHCNFILNVAPNRDGRIDDNVIAELKEIGRLWKNPGKAEPLNDHKKPITAPNLALHQRMNSSWSYDMDISDFANDDNYQTRWSTNPEVTAPFLEVVFGKTIEFNAIGFVELDKGRGYSADGKTNIQSYNLQYWDGMNWINIDTPGTDSLVRIHRFSTLRSTKIRLQINSYIDGISISELMVYNENENENENEK